MPEVAQSLERALSVGAFTSLSAKMRRSVVEILVGLKSMKLKVRLTLINLVGLTEKTVGEDAFFGLEIDARNAIAARQANAQPLVISLD